MFRITNIKIPFKVFPYRFRQKFHFPNILKFLQHHQQFRSSSSRFVEEVLAFGKQKRVLHLLFLQINGIPTKFEGILVVRPKPSLHKENNQKRYCHQVYVLENSTKKDKRCNSIYNTAATNMVTSASSNPNHHSA